MNNKIHLGYDFFAWDKYKLKIPINCPFNAHTIIVGGSGSGKSTCILYSLYKLKKYNPILYICDFKNSREFENITHNYGVFDECYTVISDFYKEFLNTEEGGNGIIKILIIDEIAGMLSHYALDKSKKSLADNIRHMISEILMLGRSRGCFLWLSMQRYSATIFPASSGSADNFHTIIGLGRLTVDGRRGLFAGEHFDGEDSLVFRQGTGIILIDGHPLQSIIFPRVSKAKILKKIRIS